MAPPTRSRKRALAAAAAPPPPVIHPSDRLSRLPDEILAQILSFLPAQEAVRTCVLARAWRHVWKFTRRLFIRGALGGTVQDVREFVDHLLSLRLNGLDCAPLDECKIMFLMRSDNDTYRTVHRWIRTFLECQVQVFRFLNEDEELVFEHIFVMDDRLLISPHLTKLEVSGILFDCIDLNLDGCPALEHLEIRSCILLGLRKIMSLSLKHLVITACESNEDSQRFKISAPCLVSLWLKVDEFRAPLLESMPELVEAYVNICSYFSDKCSCDDPMFCYHVMRDGDISDGHVDRNDELTIGAYCEPNTAGCVVLEGLAQAKDLVLLAHHSTYIFRRDLRFCPTFSNLKTLVVNGYWCETEDCRALACILEHAPVLEKLTVLFSEMVELQYDIVFEGHPDATAGSTMTTQCLKTVKVKCHTVDGGVQNVLKFLRTLNICFNSE